MALDPVSAGIDLVGTVINKFFPDADQKQKDALAITLATMQQQSDQMKDQSAINNTEAANPNLFVSGGRPFIIWICGSALGMQFLVGPLGTWVAALCGSHVVFPSLDINALLGLMVPILGLGAYRTVEKIKGVA